MKVHNWSKWQTYRHDRGLPPWIKIHRCLMRNRKWITLTDAQRGQLVSIWMLAADENGQITDDPALIRKICYLDNEPDLKFFIAMGFLDAKAPSRRRQADATTTPTWRQSDRPKAETKAEAEADTEAEEDGVSKKKHLSSGDDLTDAKKLNGHDKSEKQKAFGNWNKIATECGLALVKNLSPERERKLAMRLHEHGLKGWNQALRNVAEMPFLLGHNARGWKVTFDFLLQPTSLNKVLEMAYERAEKEESG